MIRPPSQLRWFCCSVDGYPSYGSVDGLDPKLTIPRIDRLVPEPATQLPHPSFQRVL